MVRQASSHRPRSASIVSPESARTVFSRMRCCRPRVRNAACRPSMPRPGLVSLAKCRLAPSARSEHAVGAVEVGPLGGLDELRDRRFGVFAWRLDEPCDREQEEQRRDGAAGGREKTRVVASAAGPCQRRGDESEDDRRDERGFEHRDEEGGHGGVFVRGRRSVAPVGRIGHFTRVLLASLGGR